MSFDTRLGAGIRQLGDTDSYRMLRGKDLDITEADALTTLEDADIFLVDEAAAGTQASTNKITAANVKTYMQSGLSSGITFSGSTANGLVTFGDSSTANVESNLLYDSSVYHMQLRAGLQGFPRFDLVTDNESSAASVFSFALETQSLANLDQLGTIDFKGGTDYSTLGVGGTGNSFCYIQGVALDVTNGSEACRLDLRVRTNGSTGGMQSGIRIDGSNSSSIVNATIGTGATSLTTLAGDLQVNGNNIKDDDGTTCITFDSSGNTTIQNNLTVGAQPDGDATLIISADTDDGTGEEGDNARLWFKQDGGIIEGAIQMSSNVLNIINNISGAGGISFQTGTTNNTGTTDPSTGATERMSISSAGGISFSGPITFVGQTAIGDSITTVDATVNNIKAAIRFGRVGTAPGDYGGACDVMQEGSVSGGGNTVRGVVYQLIDSSPSSGTPTWRETNATTATGAIGLLAVALGTTPAQGMLLRGTVVIDSSVLPNATPGATLFLRDSTGGRMTATPPSSTGDIQRIVGHYLTTTATTSHSMIYFNPSQEFIEIA